MDKTFDFLNCRSLFGKGYKSPINVKNALSRISFLRDTKQYLLSLEDSVGTKIIHTKRRMFVVGFCVTIDSVTHLIQQLLLQNGINGVKLTYVLTYKLSQDNIEILFSIIRRRGGWSNNPTALQFRAAYRALLSHIGVSPSTSGSCAVDDSDDILFDSGASGDDAFVESYVTLQDHTYSSLLPTLSKYVEDVSTYIAGFVVRKLLPKVKCDECRSLLVDTGNTDSSALICVKKNGGLVIPSAAVVRTVHVAERKLRAPEMTMGHTF